MGGVRAVQTVLGKAKETDDIYIRSSEYITSSTVSEDGQEEILCHKSGIFFRGRSSEGPPRKGLILLPYNIIW